MRMIIVQTNSSIKTHQYQTFTVTSSLFTFLCFSFSLLLLLNYVYAGAVYACEYSILRTRKGHWISPELESQAVASDRVGAGN